MSPAPSNDPVKKHSSPVRSQNASNGVCEDQEEDKWYLLQDKDRSITVTFPLSMTPSHPTLSPPKSPSPQTIGFSPLPATSTQLQETLHTKPSDLKGDEESGGGGGGRQDEEEGKRNKGTAYNPEIPRRVRDLAAYWVLGFCNNFTYWVMITAAYDLLAVQDQEYGDRAPPTAFPGHPLNVSSLDVTVRLPGWSNDSVNTFNCHGHSTGAILLADTLPAAAITLAAPFTLLLGVGLRVWLVTLLCIASYLVLGIAPPSLVFLGVALASASRGFSDTTFLGYTSNYHKHVLSLWSSGTGVATFMGPLLFSAMTTAGLHPRHALLTFLVVPLLIVTSFWCVLSHSRPHRGHADLHKVDSAALVCEEEMEGKKQKKAAIVKEKIQLWGRTQKYLLPMGVFYLIMYLTNQGLLEMVFFPESPLSHAQQYSWSITIRCFGTLISRSSHKLFRLSSSWLYSIFAVTVMAVVATEVHYHYLPSEYIVFALLLIQGLAEGAVFTATIFNLHKKTGEEEREFCLSILPTYFFLPAILAGFISIPTHDFLCRHHLYRQ